MGNAIITFKLMPESPEENFEKIAKLADEIVKKHGAKGATRTEINPIAFGLKEVLVLGMFEVGSKSFEEIAEEMEKIPGVSSAEIAKMDLALG